VRPFTDISSPPDVRVLTAAGRANSFMPRPHWSLHHGCHYLCRFIASIYPAGRIAERRGRSFKVWAWIAVFIGPLALPLVFLMPNLHGENVGHA
jgi:hypothetical protein